MIATRIMAKSTRQRCYDQTKSHNTQLLMRGVLTFFVHIHVQGSYFVRVPCMTALSVFENVRWDVGKYCSAKRVVAIICQMVDWYLRRDIDFIMASCVVL
jgi:hypothetical protein